MFANINLHRKDEEDSHLPFYFIQFHFMVDDHIDLLIDLSELSILALIEVSFTLHCATLKIKAEMHFGISINS